MSTLFLSGSLANSRRPCATIRSILVCGAIALIGTGCGTSRGSDSQDGSGNSDSDGNTDSDDQSTSATAQTSSSIQDSSGDSDASDSSDDANTSTESDSFDIPKFDLDVPDMVEEEDCENSEEGCRCTAVDILFVIDNSVSMLSQQKALGEAFPTFVEAIVQALPPGVDVHVGVTSTEMGVASLGVLNGCFSPGGDTYYVTPDKNPTPRPAAQGRLAEVDGKYFYEFKTNDSAAELAAASDWFARAALLGTNGSNVEMATAGAGWAADPANDATNDGFIRDAGAVLAVFFVQDEPDQTPVSVGGKAMFDKLAQRKTVCGGERCIIGGGLVDLQCLPQVPLGDFFDEMVSNPAIIEQIPSGGVVGPDDYTKVLKGALAQVIDEACDNIIIPK